MVVARTIGLWPRSMVEVTVYGQGPCTHGRTTSRCSCAASWMCSSSGRVAGNSAAICTSASRQSRSLGAHFPATGDVHRRIPPAGAAALRGHFRPAKSAPSSRGACGRPQTLAAAGSSTGFRWVLTRTADGCALTGIRFMAQSHPTSGQGYFSL